MPAPQQAGCLHYGRQDARVTRRPLPKPKASNHAECNGCPRENRAVAATLGPRPPRGRTQAPFLYPTGEWIVNRA